MTIDPELAIAAATALVAIGGNIAQARSHGRRIDALAAKVHALSNSLADVPAMREDMRTLDHKVERLLWRLITFPNTQQTPEGAE